MKTFRFSDLSTSERIVNFRVNDSGFLEKRTGTRLAVSMPYKIRGALAVSTADADQIYVVAGSRLYKLTMGSDGILSSLTLGTLSGAVFSSDTERAEVFMFAGRVCVLAGGEYFSSDGSTVSKVEGYIPLIQKNTSSLGKGEAYERINLLTNKVRMRFIADGSTREFRINYPVASVDAVYIGSTLLTAEDDYVVSTTSTYTTVTTVLAYSALVSDNDILQVYFTISKTNERSRVTSCTHSVPYGGDTDSRIFLWGGKEIANVFPSEPSDAENGQSIAYDYFPVGTPITVGDGNLPVCGACRQFDRLALFTSESAYYTYPHDDGIVNELRRFSYPVLPLNSDVGATKAGGAVLVENEPYSLSRNSLYRFKSTTIRDERLAIRVEPPAYLGFTTEQTEAMKLYVNKLRGELWCYGVGNGVAVYNARRNCWYSFTGFDAAEIFTFQGEPAYFKDKKLYLTNTSVYADSGTKYSAYCESGWLDLGDAFALKTLKSFGVSIGESSTARSAIVTLTADCGVYPENDSSAEAHPLRVVENVFNAPPADSPTSFRVRGRLGRVAHLKVRVAAGSDGLGLVIREFAVTV